MNDLIWLLYLSDIVGSINIICCVMLVISSIVCGIAVFVTAFFSMEGYSKTDELKVVAGKKLLKKLTIFIAIVSVVGTLVPNKSTIHALIAVRAGEAAVNTKLGEKAIKALDSVLDRVIEQTQPEAPKK